MDVLFGDAFCDHVLVHDQKRKMEPSEDSRIDDCRVMIVGF
jgi:hypothetical protein